MWTFQSLRESASGLFRRQEEHQGSHGPAHKDAMNNLVTPQSIVKFTVPQMRSHALPETSLTPPEESKRDCWLEDDREKPCHGNKSDRGIVIPGRSESPSFRTPNGSPSSWSFRSKWLRMKPDSRPASPVPHAIPQVVETTCGSPTHTPMARDQVEGLGMSLQHLVERKDGFDLLTESPNTKRKESLFHAQSENKLLTGKNGASHCGNKSLRERNSEFSEDSIFSYGYGPQATLETAPGRGASYKSQPEHLVKMKEKHFKLPSISSDEAGSVGTSEMDEAISSPSLNDSDQDLYRRITAAATPAIHLCVTYSPEEHRIDVVMMEGKDFNKKQFFYVKVSLLPHEISYRSDTIKPDEPCFKIQEQTAFENIQEEDLQQMCLKICCKEKVSRIRHADVIGECILPLFDIRFDKPNDCWVSLKPVEEEETPHLLISLSYDDMLRCLTIDVIAARSVPKGKLGRLPDTYVSLTEKGVDTKYPMKNTKVIQRTQHPVFGKSFLFSFWKGDGLDHLAVVASLYIKDRVRGTSELVGKVGIGQNVESALARSQFAKAIIQMGKSVTRWHPLSNPRGEENWRSGVFYCYA